MPIYSSPKAKNRKTIDTLLSKCSEEIWPPLGGRLPVLLAVRLRKEYRVKDIKGTTSKVKNWRDRRKIIKLLGRCTWVFALFDRTNGILNEKRGELNTVIKREEVSVW